MGVLSVNNRKQNLHLVNNCEQHGSLSIEFYVLVFQRVFHNNRYLRSEATIWCCLMEDWRLMSVKQRKRKIKRAKQKRFEKHTVTNPTQRNTMGIKQTTGNGHGLHGHSNGHGWPIVKFLLWRCIHYFLLLLLLLCYVICYNVSLETWNLFQMQEHHHSNIKITTATTTITGESKKTDSYSHFICSRLYLWLTTSQRNTLNVQMCTH